MDDYILTEDEYKIFNDLIKTTMSIEVLYKQLYRSEISNNKDTEEFKKILQYLETAIEVEEKLYDNLNLTIEKCGRIRNFMLQYKFQEMLPSDREYIIKHNYSNRVLRRIFNGLIANFNLSKNVLDDTSLSEYIPLLKSFGISFEENTYVVRDSVYTALELDKQLDSNVITSLISFIEECINDKKYENIKYELIRAKYNAIFINKGIEREMLSSDFVIADEIHCDRNYVFKTIDADKDEISKITNEQYEEIINDQISRLIEISDAELNDVDNKLTAVLRQCFMRSGLLLVDNDLITDINYDFNEAIESNSFHQRRKYNEAGIEMVKNCFRSVKTDKTKIKRIRIKIEN